MGIRCTWSLGGACGAWHHVTELVLVDATDTHTRCRGTCVCVACSNTSHCAVFCVLCGRSMPNTYVVCLFSRRGGSTRGRAKLKAREREGGGRAQRGPGGGDSCLLSVPYDPPPHLALPFSRRRMEPRPSSLVRKEMSVESPKPCCVVTVRCSNRQHEASIGWESLGLGARRRPEAENKRVREGLELRGREKEVWYASVTYAGVRLVKVV